MRILFRLTFWVYAIGVFALTHWPELRVESSLLPRVDIHIHMTVFGTWAALLLLSGYLAEDARDPQAESRGLRGWLKVVLTPRAILLTVLVGVVYAGFDESTQAIPMLGRTAAWDDYAADCGGIVVAALVATLVRRRLRRA
jgi:hypothetical protein